MVAAQTQPAVCCVPGTLCDDRLFDPLLALLDFAAVVVALTGETVGEAADAVLAAAPSTPFVAIGFSLGGFVVLELLRRAPPNLVGAVLIASHAEADTPAAAGERLRQARLFDREGSAALIADLWPRYAAPGASKNLRATIAAMAAGFSSTDLAAQSAIAASRPDRRADVRSGVPVLVVAGAADVLCPPGRARSSAAALGARYVEIQSAGHFVPLEAPEALAATIAAAIAGWAATTPELAQCC